MREWRAEEGTEGISEEQREESEKNRKKRGNCGDKLLSSLHNFKYHLQEWNNPGMASTAGGVYSGRKPGPHR
jgi:hypothetical protein